MQDDERKPQTLPEIAKLISELKHAQKSNEAEFKNEKLPANEIFFMYKRDEIAYALFKAQDQFETTWRKNVLEKNISTFYQKRNSKHLFKVIISFFVYHWPLILPIVQFFLFCLFLCTIYFLQIQMKADTFCYISMILLNVQIFLHLQFFEPLALLFIWFGNLGMVLYACKS